MHTLTADLCVIGAGAGGLSVAAGAAQLGARTVLIERGKMGGDCLNTGCVPSKALLAAAHIAALPARAADFGIGLPRASVDFVAVHRHVHAVIAGIAPNDSVERFEGLGVRVLRAHARFADAGTVVAGDWRITARRFVIATGSGPAVPPIPGLADAGFLTNETLFGLTEAPAHLIVIGGGPIGIEMAQAFARLGSRVSVLEMASILPRDDPELVAVVRERLREDGVALLEAVAVRAVEGRTGDLAVVIEHAGRQTRIAGSHLLVAAGRRPCVEDLDLERAGIAYTRSGIGVDARLRTSNRKVFAIGDVIGGPQFTHVAGYHAGIVIKNALFRVPARADHRSVPRVTYTDPELAQVGLSEAEARAGERAGERGIRVLRWPYDEIDRARAERRADGLAKVIIGRRGRILGAGIVGAAAGELIQCWSLAMHAGLGIGRVATMIAPYPSYGEINKKIAGSAFTPALFSARTRRLVRWLSYLP